MVLQGSGKNLSYLSWDLDDFGFRFGCIFHRQLDGLCVFGMLTALFVPRLAVIMRRGSMEIGSRKRFDPIN